MLAKGTGTTPWKALQDPDFEFNVAVMRGYLEARRMHQELAVSAGADPLAIAAANEED